MDIDAGPGQSTRQKVRASAACARMRMDTPAGAAARPRMYRRPAGARSPGWPLAIGLGRRPKRSGTSTCRRGAKILELAYIYIQN